jgi:hypothetical protein
MGTWMLLMLFILPVPWIAKAIWPREITLPEIGCTTIVAVLLTSVVYFLGIAGKTHDVEIWNGEITGKERVHDTYEEAYSCNCRQTCSGSGNNRSCSQTCDTCYRTHYTVHWNAASTIGEFGIDSKDWTSRAVYLTPDPARYTVIKTGDPCSRDVSFVNYVKAVPDSLFHANPLLAQKFAGMIPVYPNQLYDIYKINRVLPVNVSVPDIQAWNQDLSMTLRKLGPQRQANAVILFVNTPDRNYINALDAAWLGGKKNDIIIAVGVTQWPRIDWVEVSSWTKQEMFKVQLRDALQDLGEVDRAKFMELISKYTMDQFVRRPMSDFKYLADEIEPAMWVIILALILGVLSSLGLSYYFYKNDPFDSRF